MECLNEAIPRGCEPRRDVMKAPDDVSAMLKLKALGWGVKRLWRTNRRTGGFRPFPECSGDAA